MDGVIFTIYELVTFDKSFREGIVYWKHDVRPVEEMAEWHVRATTLEPGLDIRTIRRHLFEWVSDRRTVRTISHCSEASEPLELPEYPADNDDEPAVNVDDFIYDHKSAIKKGASRWWNGSALGSALKPATLNKHSRILPRIVYSTRLLEKR